MRLIHLKVQNYRALKDFEIDIDQFLVVLGENNSGKSTVFRAMELLLSTGAKNIAEDSFHNFDTLSPITLIGIFDNLNEEERNELYAWVLEGKLTIKKEYKLIDGKIETSYFGIVKVPKEDWLNDRFSDYNNREKVSTLPIREFLPETGRITRETYNDAVEKYKEKYFDSIDYQVIEKKISGAFKQKLDDFLPQFQLIPAIREVSDETKNNSTSILGKLVSLVSSHIITDNPKFKDFQEQLNKLNDLFEGQDDSHKLEEIEELEKSLEEAMENWDVSVNINIVSPDFNSILQAGTHITIDDGVSTTAEQKGHGLQRSLIFALIRRWAELNSKSYENSDKSKIREKSLIFAFEEPELFLHPHICRATYQALKSLSSAYQILLCTHSAHFVNMGDYHNIAILRKQGKNGGTISYRVREELFGDDRERKKRFNMVQFFNPDRSEVFFAKKAALVEGPTEKALIPYLASRLGIENYKISIINCEGKDNLTLYMKVMNAFRIPYTVVYDEDPIPENIKPGEPNFNEDKYRTKCHFFGLNSIIENECDTEIGFAFKFPGELESSLGISKNYAEKVGKPYAALEMYSKDEQEIPEILEKLIRQIYSY